MIKLEELEWIFSPVQPEEETEAESFQCSHFSTDLYLYTVYFTRDFNFIHSIKGYPGITHRVILLYCLRTNFLHNTVLSTILIKTSDFLKKPTYKWMFTICTVQERLDIIVITKCESKIQHCDWKHIDNYDALCCRHWLIFVWITKQG